MPGYHLYYVRNAHAMGLDVFDAQDDGQAIDYTIRYHGAQDIELQCGDRVVRHFEIGTGTGRQSSD
jgi:hypothetical protein